jgi:hypothetical protein
MYRLPIQLLAFSLLILPCRGFAQNPSGSPTATVQHSEKCGVEIVPVHIKLKSGEKVKGGLLEKTADQVKVCRKGSVIRVSTDDIWEMKTKMTGNQRFTHSIKVIGIFVGAFIAFGFLRYLAVKDQYN